VEENLGLVYAVARRYHCEYLEQEDIVQNGMLGLMRAAQCFQRRRKIRFSTYATFWIRSSILTQIDRRQKSNRNARLLASTQRFRPRDPSVEQSAFEPRDPKAGPAELAESRDVSPFLARALARMSRRNREIVIRRVVGGETFHAIADDFGLSRQRVQQLVKRALEHAARWIAHAQERARFAAGTSRIQE
jgi:RNA polymerase sigma factor (sigma-70 family)